MTVSDKTYLSGEMNQAAQIHRRRLKRQPHVTSTRTGHRFDHVTTQCPSRGLRFPLLLASRRPRRDVTNQ